MKPDVSLITATSADPGRMAYTERLHGTLVGSSARWQWLICVDGGDPELLPGAVRADRRVTVMSLPRSFGAATARNLALTHATAPWITSADDDDELPAGSLETRLTAAEADRAVGWVAGQLADLQADGTALRWDSPAAPGLHEPGSVWRSWPHPDAPVPIGPTTLLVAADVLRHHGGWQGLPQGEDLGMVCSVTGSHCGVVLPDVVYHYRVHDAQMTRSSGFSELERTVRSATWERGRLIAAAHERALPAAALR